MTNDTSGIYFTWKNADYNSRNHIPVSRGCACVYTLLPNLNKMEFIYLNSIPAPTPVIRSLSIWKMMNERTAISIILVPSAWVPGNWQAMWIFHTNYSCTISFLMLTCRCFCSDLPHHGTWLVFMASCMVFHVFSSWVSINSTFFSEKFQGVPFMWPTNL